MAVKVGVSGAIVKTVTGGNSTIVKRVVVGRPVKTRITSPFTLDNLQDVDVSSKPDGSLLIYNSGSSQWESSTLIEKQTINGGNY